MTDLVLVTAPDVEIPKDIADRAADEGRRVIRSRLAPRGYVYECDLEALSPVPDEWLEHE